MLLAALLVVYFIGAIVETIVAAAVQDILVCAA
jgi:hypothetical protein